MKLMRWFAMLAVLTATSAYAQDVTTSGTKPTPKNSSGVAISGTAQIKAVMVGGASSDTTRWVLPISAGGATMATLDANSISPTWVTNSFGIESTSIPAGTILKGTPINVSNYKSFALQFSFAQADTDSCALEIFVIGKQTANGADGLDAIFMSDTSSVGPKGWMVCNNVPVQAAANFPGLYEPNYRTKSTTTIRGLLHQGIMGVTTNSLLIPIVDAKNRSPAGYNYINVWIYNMRTAAAVVTCELQMRPN